MWFIITMFIKLVIQNCESKITVSIKSCPTQPMPRAKSGTVWHNVPTVKLASGYWGAGKAWWPARFITHWGKPSTSQKSSFGNHH